MVATVWTPAASRCPPPPRPTPTSTPSPVQARQVLLRRRNEGEGRGNVEGTSRGGGEATRGKERRRRRKRGPPGTAAKDAKAAAKRSQGKHAEGFFGSRVGALVEPRAGKTSEAKTSQDAPGLSPPRRRLRRRPRRVGLRVRQVLRHGAVHLRSGGQSVGRSIGSLRGAAVHSAAVVGKSLHDAGHAMTAAVGSVVKNVVNASVNTWRSVRDSDLAKSAVVATRRFLARRPWEPHLERCSWNARTPASGGGPGSRARLVQVLKAVLGSFPDLTPPIAPARSTRTRDEARVVQR